MIRKPAVAGMFYDSDPDELKKVVSSLLIEGPRTRALGVIAPHAGYTYSGAVAGKVYSMVEIPETTIIFSPNHTGLGAAGSMMCRGGWETPLGVVAIDEELAAAILKETDFLKEDSLAHLNEHSIEVQLPFLQCLAGEKIVPITLMGTPYKTCEQIGLAVARVVKALDRPILMVASSDMTHFESRESAGAKDRLALERIEALDPAGLYEVVCDRKISMCGFIPSTIMLVAAKALGAKRSAVVQYADSGDVTRDYDSVVGYAGVIVD
jgi:AmmeMemoRadiSam system protein B